ncbi:MAG: hypothetical protein ACE5F1_05250 [Planctomycetota bacterium]
MSRSIGIALPCLLWSAIAAAQDGAARASGLEKETDRLSRRIESFRERRAGKLAKLERAREACRSRERTGELERARRDWARTQGQRKSLEAAFRRLLGPWFAGLRRSLSQVPEEGKLELPVEHACFWC